MFCQILYAVSCMSSNKFKKVHNELWNYWLSFFLKKYINDLTPSVGCIHKHLYLMFINFVISGFSGTCTLFNELRGIHNKSHYLRFEKYLFFKVTNSNRCFIFPQLIVFFKKVILYF